VLHHLVAAVIIWDVSASDNHDFVS